MANPRFVRITMHYVYILKLSNNQIYTGYTKDIRRRIKEHKGGKVKFTRRRLPIKLIHYECYKEGSDASRREKYLKTTEGKRFLRKQIRDIMKKEGCQSGRMD